MHEIQKHILKKLSIDKKAKYSEIKPRGIEGNLFVYHIKKLVREGYISTEKDLYLITPNGKRFMDRVSFETLTERIQPKIVTLIVLKEGNKYLLYRRRRSPFINRVGFPYGKIHIDERILEAAERELKEKTDLKANLKHRGIVYINTSDETELISHMLCHIFVGSRVQGKLRSDTSMGECFWSKIEEIPKDQLIPGVSQIINLIEANPSKLFFAEYFLNTTE